MAEDGAEATLELTILSAEGLKDSTFLSSSRPSVVAWVDPSMKRSTKLPHHALPRSTSTPQKLHIPLSSHSLWDPTSCLTIQIVSPSLIFQSGKPIGTATLHISSATFSGKTLTLPLRRMSGRTHGLLLVSVRVLWCLDAPPVAVDSVAGVSIGVDGADFIPTAPPMPEDLSYLSEFQEDEIKETTLQSFFPSAPIDEHEATMIDSGILSGPADDRGIPSAPIGEHDATMSDLGSAAVSEEVDVPDLALNADRTRLRVIPDGTNAWRSFLVGLVSGTVAAVLVGVAGLSEG